MLTPLLLALVVIASSLDVPLCSSPDVPLLRFTYIDSQPDDTTNATLCHDGTNLVVRWFSRDKEIISTYGRCNDPLYKEDAVEIFIATPDSYPHHYFELEVSPRAQLFFADITNPNGTCSQLGTDYYPCNAATYSASKTAVGWDAEVKIQLSVIGRGVVQKKFKVNLFRIDYTTNAPTRYLTWQPTFASPPCFHKPAFFQ